MPSNVLFTPGTLNQAKMFVQVAGQMPNNMRPFFSSLYLNSRLGKLLLDFLKFSRRHHERTLHYLLELKEQGKIELDTYGAKNNYSLYVTSIDFFFPKNTRGIPKVLIQEGLFEPEDWRYPVARAIYPLRFVANTAATGLSDGYAYFCVASQGHKELLAKKIPSPRKLKVTGVPGYDSMKDYFKNDIRVKGYVLAATSAIRETLRHDDRAGFIRKAVKIAAGRPLYFKLHPAENRRRAEKEIRKYAPQAKICEGGEGEEWVANCSVLITQRSTLTLVGLALGKEVHTDLDKNVLARLCPDQNGGASAKNIAEVCRAAMEEAEFNPKGFYL